MRVGQLTTAGARRTRTTAVVPPDRGEDAVTVARPSRSEIPAPLILERYRLVRRLGSGGFGTVWMARDERLERDVAVKILPRQIVLAGRFEREAHAAARLSHPGIVTLYEAASDDEGAYLVSELVRGMTLERALVAGRLSDRAILEIGLALCDALDHAHEQGVVHRDVKPSNILLPARATSPAQTAKLTDFGVARLVGGDTLTRTGELVGTAAYMAPEQAEGREAGAAADLYSLALVLYEALTGVNPVPVAAHAVTGQRPRRLALHLPPLRRQRRELPRELGQAVDLALRPRARERGTIGELRAALLVSHERAADVPGVVGAPRFTRAERTERAERAEWDERAEHDARPDRTGRPNRSARERGEPVPPAEQDTDERRSPLIVVLGPRPTPLLRGLAGLAGAWLAAWACAHVLHPAPVPGATAALVAAVTLVLLPRLGWLTLVLALVVTLAVQGRPGAAVVLAAAALLPVFALPGAGGAWPVAALAAGLGAIGLAGAWPALAARAPGAWRRAALGALGWVWLSLGGVLAGQTLYVRRPPGLPPASGWALSVPDAVHHALVPLVNAGLPAGAAVWAAAAVLLPFMGSRISPRHDALAVLVWAVGTALATAVVLNVAGAGSVTPSGPLLALGAVAAAIAALVGRSAGRMLAQRQSSGAWPGLA
jgi:eukaryotic-like serine/threonine-protein kinase